MKKIKLNKLSNDKLNEKELAKLTGGYTYWYDGSNLCGCGCYYSGSGGSSTNSNAAANGGSGKHSTQR